MITQVASLPELGIKFCMVVHRRANRNGRRRQSELENQ